MMLLRHAALPSPLCKGQVKTDTRLGAPSQSLTIIGTDIDQIRVLSRTVDP
jgi:hypothetical protein